jgi:acetyltransferase-like isoleucine patch superfamily enzyme
MTDERFPGCRVHPTALIEEGVYIGNGSSIWDNVHIRHGAKIGKSCIIGEKTYIAYDVNIGDYCKLNAAVYVCAQVEIADYVMLAAHTVFTNDRFPRAFDISLDGLASSDPNEETLWTRVGRGLTTGANVTIGPGLNLGEFAMIGMGSVVTKDVPANGLVIGNPAKLVAYLCACGPVIVRLEDFQKGRAGSQWQCSRCGRVYQKSDAGVKEVQGPTKSGHH